MSEVAYFSPPELPEARHFHCRPLSMSLSVETCAARHITAQEGQRCFACRRCDVGAMHAGRPRPINSALATRTLCSRCRNLARRLIGERLCPSCYNRELEATKNRNGKGQKPRKLTLAMLAPASVLIVRTEGRPNIYTVKRATGFAESVIAASRRHGADAWFGRANIPPPHPCPVTEEFSL